MRWPLLLQSTGSQPRGFHAGSSEPAAGRAALGPGAEPPPPPPACGRRPAAARSPLGSLGPGRDLLLSPGLVHPPPSCPLLWYSIASYSSLLPTGRVSMALGLEGLKLSCLRQPSDEVFVSEVCALVFFPFLDCKVLGSKGVAIICSFLPW